MLAFLQHHPKFRRRFPIRHYAAIAGAVGVGDAVDGADAVAVAGIGAAFFETWCCHRPSGVVVVASVPGEERPSPIAHHWSSLRYYFEDRWTPTRSNPVGHRRPHAFAPKSPHSSLRHPYHLRGR